MKSLRTELGTKLRELKEGSKSGAAGGKPKKPWRFLIQLMFPRDVIVPRVTNSNLDCGSADPHQVSNKYAFC